MLCWNKNKLTGGFKIIFYNFSQKFIHLSDVIRRAFFVFKTGFHTLEITSEVRIVSSFNIIIVINVYVNQHFRARK